MSLARRIKLVDRLRRFKCEGIARYRSAERNERCALLRWTVMWLPLRLKGSIAMLRRGIALTFAVVLALLLIAPAEAHATLVRSEPSAGALLTAAPKELVLEFSERVDPSFSAVRLLNSNNQVVNVGPGVVDPATPRMLRLALADLPKDSYTATWKV